MARKSGLGKGLDALIPTENFLSAEEKITSEAGILQIPIDQIIPNPHQPRTHFDQQDLSELASSIREHGVLQPLLVTAGSTPQQYILIAGERRLLASRQAGLDRVPAMLREATEQERVELALIENLQRSDLSPLETAEAYRQLSEEYALPHEQIADRVGKSRTSVTNTLRLLKLPSEVQQALAGGQISEGHARALLGLPSSQAQIAALQTILKKELTVRQTEALVRLLVGQKPASSPKVSKPPEIEEIEAKLRQSLGTKVSLNQHRKGGTLVIHYYSDEELTTLVEQLLRQS
jgi:ParB family transcriptional regulator, chromosome partitioning protein